MFFKYDKIRKDNDYYILVILIHILLYYMPILNLKQSNWNFNFAETGNDMGFIILITISLIVVLFEKYKK